MAAFWFMPFLSVRNLVEIFAIPFLLTGTYLLLLKDKAISNKLTGKGFNIVFVAGIVMGIAFSVRFQTILFIGGTGLVLLIQRKWIDTILFGTGALISIVFFQSIVDIFIWGYPFAEFSEYVRYNIENRNNYLTGPWHMYLGVLAGLFLIPLGLFILFGYFIAWKKHLLIFLPSFIFLAFHSYFPNKQERFIFTIIPFIVILGITGWETWIKKSGMWQKISYYGMIVFWVLNLMILSVISISSSKKSQVQAMSFLSGFKVSSFLTDCTGDGKFVFMPRFYSGQWPDEYVLRASEILNPETFKKNIGIKELAQIYNDQVLLALKHPNVHSNSQSYNRTYKLEDIDFILFVNEENLEKRVALMKELIPDLKFQYKAEPGLLDKIVHKLNPVNKNQEIFVYSAGEPVMRNR
ncbi:MAG: hypothetical protein IPH57_02665 [Saprospiraceae bacterium]|nr:hypothetical protein [Saprospiraceae bacterium]